MTIYIWNVLSWFSECSYMLLLHHSEVKENTSAQWSCCAKCFEDEVLLPCTHGSGRETFQLVRREVSDWFLVTKLEVLLVIGGVIGTGLLSAWETQPALESRYLWPVTQFFCFADVHSQSWAGYAAWSTGRFKNKVLLTTDASVASAALPLFQLTVLQGDFTMFIA